jgi:ABC-type Fe3+/spermidine/putrescine transport system ATPase subunit
VASAFFSSAKRYYLPPEKARLRHGISGLCGLAALKVFDNVAFASDSQSLACDMAERAKLALQTYGARQITSGHIRTNCRADRSSALPWPCDRNQSHVMLLDEPLSNLDPKLLRRCGLRSRTCSANSGLRIIFVTHDISQMRWRSRTGFWSCATALSAGRLADQHLYKTAKPRYLQFFGLSNFFRSFSEMVPLLLKELKMRDRLPGRFRQIAGTTALLLRLQAVRNRPAERRGRQGTRQRKVYLGGYHRLSGHGGRHRGSGPEEPQKPVVQRRESCCLRFSQMHWYPHEDS